MIEFIVLCRATQVVGTDAQTSGRSATLLYVWLHINPALDTNRGDILANLVGGSLIASLRFDRDLENSQLCSDPAYVTNLYQLV
jgi:hypothetical protein